MRLRRGSSFYCIKSARQTDLVITKSVSRFARNTQDSLNYSRKLKALGIPIIFEKENVNTMNSSGELSSSPFFFTLDMKQKSSYNDNKGTDSRRRRFRWEPI